MKINLHAPFLIFIIAPIIIFNQKLNAQISGNVFQDYNGNGVQDNTTLQEIMLQI